MTAEKDSQPHFQRVAICGVGLLGGSLGIAIHERGLAEHVVGVGRNVERLQIALNRNIIDTYDTDIRRACSDTDLIVLCGPVSVIMEQLPIVMECAPKGALVTDVGSTKQSIVECAVQASRKDVWFVGSHPMAGSEKSGLEFSRADLYQNATAILTPDLDTPEHALALTRSLWEALGMRVLEVSPSRHDHLLAAMSHLPHIAAAALVAHLEKSLDEDSAFLTEIAGPGFRETTRIAMGSVPMWIDICTENRQAILHVLDAFISVCLEARKAIHDGDRDGLTHFLDTAQQLRKEF